MKNNKYVIKLASGYDMPMLGHGTRKVFGKVLINAIKTSLGIGYRHLTWMGNPAWAKDKIHLEELTEALRRSGVDRKKVFIMSLYIIY